MDATTPRRSGHSATLECQADSDVIRAIIAPDLFWNAAGGGGVFFLGTNRGVSLDEDEDADGRSARDGVDGEGFVDDVGPPGFAGPSGGLCAGGRRRLALRI